MIETVQGTGTTLEHAALINFANNVMLNGVGNEGTRHVYRAALSQLFDWMVANRMSFTRADVRTYLVRLQEAGKASATRNTTLAAIKRLAKEAYYAGQLPHEVYLGIDDVRGEKHRVVRPAHWLSLRQVNELLSLPDVKTMRGLRDRAILGVLIGCALRRAEICDLTIGNIEQRSGRWVFIVRGKGDKTRIVGIAPGLKVSIDEWVGSLEWDDVPVGFDRNKTPLFCAIRKGTYHRGQPNRNKLSAQSIQDVVHGYAIKLNPPLPTIAPHDMRRTHARLAREAGHDLEQIQFTLGHDSIQTTALYLGKNQKLDRTSGDALDVDWQGGTK